MKIAFDYEIFWKQKFGGIASRYFFNLINYFFNKGIFDIKVFSKLYLNRRLEELPKEIIYGSKINYLPPFTGRFFEFYSRYVSNKKMLNYNSDIIHKTYYSNKFLKKTNTRVVLTVYDLFHEIYSSKLKYRPKKNAIKIADHILCPSFNTKKDLIELYNIDEKKISVTYFGIENLKKYNFKDFSIKFEKPFILFVGARGRYKNFTTFIKAFSKSKKLKKDFSVVCFGGEEFNKEESNLFNDLGLSESISRQTSTEDKTLAYLYKNAKCLIFPSGIEGLGLPPLEAMSLGCPVISSNHKAIVEGVGEAAALFNPLDVDEILYVLEKTLYSKNKLDELVKKGLIQSKNFSWAKCAEQTLEIYNKII